MARTHSDKPRPRLTVTRDEAKQRITAQIEKARTVPNASVNENDEARRWYEFTAELLMQLFTTDELSDEFTGRSSIVSDGDISMGHFLKRLVSIHDRLDLYPEDTSVAPANAPTDPIAIIKRLISKFHVVARQLHRRHTNRPTLNVTDEYDVQDLFHALLRIHFDDVRPEEWTPSYAGGSSRMDFLLKAESIVVEVKKTRKKLGAKEIGEQLAIDMLRYRSHPDCKTLICFVYDPEEQIVNPRGLEQDLSQPIVEMKVQVFVVPK